MTDTPKRAALYQRVYTGERSTGAQLIELAYIAARAGWDRVAVYRDSRVLGAKGRVERPGFDRMLKDATRRQFDVLMAWSVDRLGSSLQDLVGTLAALQAAGIDLYLKEQEVDTTTPSGRALFQMIGILAEAERAMIRERVQAGINRARGAGKRLGRPKIDAQLADAIRAALASGVSIRRAAKLHGVGVSTVQRLKTVSSASESDGSPGSGPTLPTNPIVEKPVPERVPANVGRASMP